MVVVRRRTTRVSLASLVATVVAGGSTLAFSADLGLPPVPPIVEPAAVVVPAPVPVPVPVPVAVSPPLVVGVPVVVPLPWFLAPPLPPPLPSPTLFSSPVALLPPPPHVVRSRDPERAEAEFYGYTGVPRPPRPPLGYIPRDGLE